MTPAGGDILVVDDDAEVRDALRSVLEDQGFAVRTANDGVAALETLERGTTPAVVLLDLMMPVMSGADVLERMRTEERFRSIPVVLTTAWPEQARMLRGAQAILPKPISLDRLLGVVTRFCAPA